MSHDEAVKLLQETYRGSMQVTKDFRIGDWQAASHLYHGNGVGVDPGAFGMSQAELDKLRGGFINYARKGYKLPSIEHVRAYQTSLKTICLDSTSIRHDDAEYYNIITNMVWREQLFFRMADILSALTKPRVI